MQAHATVDYYPAQVGDAGELGAVMEPPVSYDPIPLMPTEAVVESLLQINAPHFCGGVVLRNGRVIDAPPIMGYMAANSWGESKVREYCKKKGWEIVTVNDP